MTRCWPSVATAATIFCFLLFSQYTQAQITEHTRPPPVNGTEPTQLICRTFGLCEPCPGDSLHEPFCQPFGNRRQMHCLNKSQDDPPNHAGQVTPPLHHPDGTHPEGETLVWEACGRLVDQERADFFEFIACIVFFATVSIAVVLLRSKRMEAMNARNLAARIGMVRNAVMRR